MKNHLLAFAAALLTSVTSVAAPTGDIYAIDPISNQFEYQAGETIQFKVRLLARDWAQNEPSPWRLVYNDFGDEDFDKALNPPRIGIVVSGKLDYADIVEFIYPKLAGEGNPYTDLVCEYKVRPGQVALPVKLALKGSNEDHPIVADEGAASDAQYLIDDRNGKWSIIGKANPTAPGTEGAAVAADFFFCDEDTAGEAKGEHSAIGTYRPDFALTQAAFRVKSVDFDNKKEDSYWRKVKEGSEETAAYRPTIETIGKITDADKATTIYVWSEDDSVIRLAGSAVQKTIPDGSATLTRYVAEIKLVPGESVYPITLRGVTKGQATKIVLSTTLGFRRDEAGDRLPNFLTADVWCDDPPQPSIQVCFDPASATSSKYLLTDTSMKMRADLAQDAVPVYVWLSKPADHPIKVTLGYRNLGEQTVDPIVNGNISISKKNTVFDKDEPPYTAITIPTGKEFVTAYVYPLGGDEYTEQGIEFTAAFVDPADADLYPGEQTAATLRIRRAPAPTIDAPANGSHIGTVSVLDGFKLPLQLGACYRDLNLSAGFDVKVKCGSSSLYDKPDILFQEGTPTDLEINEGYTYDSKNPTKTAKITVTTPDGRVVTSEFTFTVQAPKTVAGELLVDGEVQTRFAESEVVTAAPQLKIRLSEAAEGKRWAYLKPLNAASANLVTCKAFETGVLIDAGETESDAGIDVPFIMKDGTALTDGTSGTLEYEIVLRKEDTPPPEVDDGQTDESFVSKVFTVKVANVPTAVKGVYLNGTTLIPNNSGDEPFAIGVTAGVETDYTIQLDEPSSIDRAANLTTIVRYTTNRNADWTTGVKTLVLESTEPIVTASFKLSTPDSLHRVKVIALDKDTIAAAGITAADYTTGAFLLKIPESTVQYDFMLKVTEEPHITVETRGFYMTARGETMDETGVNKLARLLITLDEPAEADTTIRVWARPNVDDKIGYVKFAAGTTSKVDTDGTAYIDLKVLEGETEPQNNQRGYKQGQGLAFDYANLDGTPNSLSDGWNIEAAVVDGSGEIVEDAQYKPFDGLTIYVENLAPTIKKPAYVENVTTNTSQQLGSAFPIKWAVDDVKKDFDYVWPNGKTGLRIEWYLNGEHQEALDAYATDSADHSSQITLKEEGLTEVEMKVYDKDAEEDERYVSTRKLLYYVRPQKKLIVTPYLPAPQSKTKYRSFPGRGEGRVWADGASPVVSDYSQTWSYKIDRATATAYAFGYASNNGVPYVDNGTLDATRDVNIGYTVEGIYDNYFYCWAYILANENGGAPTMEIGPINPTARPTAATSERVTLDPYEENKVSYLDRQVEAIFSREYLTSDNMGDINADRVPDIYVMRYEGLGVVDGFGVVTGDDKPSVAASNPDGDMLPGDLSAVMGSFIPGLSNNWSRAFTTVTEIRGVGEHLNTAPQAVGLSDFKPDVRYTDPRIDEASTLSVLEYVAFTNWCGRTAGEDEDAFIALTNTTGWAKWTPENPTDPTVDDTDEDGMPDGYEYYYWYKAHVGEIDVDGDGNVKAYRRMTGRRYVPADPCNPEIISADRIEEICNPTVKSDGFATDWDTDNDGITDLDELVAGTNPFDYDTDGDGLPDGYELAISKTNPLVADRGSNVDGDQMALITLENVIPVTCVYKEDDNTVTNMLWSMERVQVAANEEDDAITNLTSKVSLFTGYVYDIDNEGKPVMALGRLVLDAKDPKYDDKVKEYNVRHVGEGRPMRAIHFQVFAIKGFDPRVAWNTEAASMTPIAHRVDTTGFTAYDEFMTMTFFLNVGAIEAGDVEPNEKRTLINIWTECTTNPLNADTDEDGVPDGWELYVMGQGEFTCQNPMPPAGQGHDNHSPMINWTGHDDVIGGLNYVEEFCGVESCARYENCETIVNIHPEWKNKYWPTNPFNADTDGDGVGDVAEKVFIYGDAPASTVYSGAIPGGGLNPNSWDTDLDGLPDGWELQFACSILVSSTTTTVETHSDTNGTTSVTNTVTTAGGPQADGMDGTVKDQMKDYDHDGLNNWQEYMVGAMRCWRYDDTTSPWAVAPLTREDVEVFSDEDFYETLVNTWSEAKNPRDFTRYNPFLASGHVSPYIYFSVANNEFDLAFGRLYMLKDGIYHDLVTDVREGDNRWSYMARNQGQPTYNTHDTLQRPAAPWRYISCDPTTPDTDGDGLDDYYELFHGLNPLLGALGMYTSTVGPCDVVAASYYNADILPLPCSAANNYWFNEMLVNTGTVNDKAQLKDASKSMFDFVQFPWLAGLPEADPDGDNIRNNQEQILTGVQAAATYQHLDPSPLWMTDSSYTNSIVRRFYKTSGGVLSFPHPTGKFTHTDADGNTTTYSFNDIPGWHWDAQSGLAQATADTNPFKTLVTMFTFEENEGYDTDHDYLSDFEESQGKTKSASDPQLSEDPVRHQAMWFDGKNSFLQSEVPVEWILPNAKTIAEFRQNFLYFTVEAWVKADASLVGPGAKSGLFTVVERPIWTGASNAGDESFLRKNFLIGIKNGRWYAKFDSSGTDLNQPIEIKEGPEATTAWTHVAATFGPADETDTSGTGAMALKLYIDGILRKSLRSGVQPEHGIKAYTYVPDAKVVPTLEWDDMLGRPLVSILVGASAKNMYGIKFDGFSPVLPTLPSDYANFFKGHVDEVRIWDGARSAAAIKADVELKTRYTTALALENRQAVYAKWSQDITRMPNASGEMLPPELMYHFSFDHVPGAVEAKDVLKTPAGFTTTKGAVDAKAKWSRPDGWVCPWWDSVTNTLRSAIYTDTAWVPWIGNTIGHLPMFDGETLDSVLWHKNFYGFKTGYFEFPLSAEPMSRMIQQSYDVEGRNDPLTQTTSYDRIAGDADALERFRFTYRNRVTAGSDLLPFGGAFPKRLSSDEGMWDAPGVASDAWAETGLDADNNGLPEWWEEYALVEYANTPSIDWDTTVDYNGIQMPAWQAYLRDLAAGMLPDGVIHPEYADTRDMDKDGLPDWWEDMYGINTHSATDADADPDHDGLSNYQEYVLSELYPRKYNLPAYGISPILLDPTRDHSGLGQQVTDYYLSYTNEAVVVTNQAGKTVFEGNNYFGEIVTDHDFMEDWWEIAMGSSYANAKKYDPLDDHDEDGWSNWAECRAALWGGYFSAYLIDKWTGDDSTQRVICYPEPVLGVRVTYHGIRDISGQDLVIRTTTGQTPRCDATFRIPAELDGQVRYIGGFNADSVMHGHMSPGCLNVNSIVFECARTSSEQVYTWNCDWYQENVPNELGWDPPRDWIDCSRTHTGSFKQYRLEYERWPKIELEGGDLRWESLGQTVPEADLNSATLLSDGVKIGSVNAVTGEWEIDFSKFSKAGGAKEYVFRVTYTSRVGHEWPQTVYVSDTRELASGNGMNAKYGNGRVREGRNTIEAFMDLNANGVLDAGEPYGSIRNVQIGWHKLPTVAIELKDESPIMGQVQLAAATGGELSELTKTVRVVRELINDLPAPRTLVTKTLVMDDRPYLTEVDACTVTRPDLDWVWLTKDAERDGIQTINRATYAVYEYDQNMATNGALLATFIKEFPEVRPMATALSPKDVAPVYSCSPTFAFTTSDEKATAYRLQVRAVGATAPIYDSGIQLLPARLGQTVGVAAYEVTPAIYADAPVYAGTTTDHAIFADGSNYQWRVALYDAKYKTTKDDSDVSGEWGTWVTFQMDVANVNRYPDLPTGYGGCGAASVAVRYFGSVECDPKRVVVEAYENADFRGQALAQIRLSDAVVLRDATDLTTYNAVLRGIKPGMTYFRAFYDQNNNGVRDNWESWGYANYIGKNVTAIYNPEGRMVTTSTADWMTQKTATVTIFIEDCDVNQNEIPDCAEEALFLAEVSAETDPVDWWDWAEANSTDVNGNEAMAYAEVTMWKVKLVDENGVENTYLTDGQGKLVEGVSAAGLNFWTYYDYSLTLLGLGTNVTTNVTAKCTIAGRPEEKKVALVHAQVLEKYGFCPDTAIPGGQTNTKPFTAMDKYLVLRYLERTGRITLPASTQAELAKKGLTFEEYVYRSGDETLYKMYTLNPAETDNDHDGIDDGWELYIDGNPLSDANRDEDEDGDGLPLWQEYDHDPVKGTYRPTNPSAIDTDADGVTDKYAYMYHLKADDAGKDFDGDGLSNYAEYLITEVFKYAVCNPDVYATNDGVCDYFRKVGDVYLGEIFTDHDQVDDVWEAQYKVDYANRYVYDPTKDADGDGWSNWSEYKAGTNPERVNTLSIGSYTLPEYPIPSIEANVIYNGASVGLHPIVFKAWNESTDFDMVKAPDAIWTLGTAVSGQDANQTTGDTSSSLALSQREKFLGRKPSGKRTYHLPGGAISEGSVKLLFMDKGYGIVRWDPLTQMLYAVANGEPDKAKWYYGIYDKDGKLVRLGNAFDEKETTVGTVDYATGEITIDFDHEENSGKWACDPGDAVSGGDTNNNNDNATQANIYEYVDFDNAYVRITWASAKVNESISGAYYLTDSDPISETAKSYGHIREGKNTFICFVDDDENGEYTPGELFGVVRGVNVGWSGVKFDLELTETHPIFGRVDFSGQNDRQIWYGNDSDNFTNLVYGVPGTEDTLPVDSSLSGGRKQRVRVDRYAVNGMTLGTTITQVNVPNRVIVDKWFDVDARRYLHEGDFMEAGEFDIDWTHLEDDILNNPIIRSKFRGEVTSMTYRIVVDNSDFVHPVVSNRVLNVAFTRHFDSTDSRTKPSDLQPILAYGARPVFKWSMNGHNSYTAFKLRILSGSQVVYESPMTVAPFVDPDGYYVYESPICVGDQTALGRVLERAGNYTWTVSMYNSKFKSDYYATPVSFTTEVNTQQDVDDHGYGTIDVAVKYAGPEAVLATANNMAAVSGKIRIQAFERPDFSGTPVAQTFVANKASVMALTEIRPNARIHGLKPGTYYIRAYIDSDGDFEKSDWESWGAAKFAVTVGPDRPVPVASVWIEDADTDGDWLPDAWEYVTPGRTVGVQDIVVDNDGEIVLKATTFNGIINGTAGISSGLSGASLTFFQNLEAAKVMLNLGKDSTTSTIQAIREAVQKKIVPNTVHVKALVVDAANKKIRLSVGGEVVDSIAGHLLSPIYTIPTTATVTISLYTKASLVDVNWIWVKDYTTTVSTTLDTTVEVDIVEDLTSGFYKVEVVQ